MNGIAIVIPDADFSSANIGKVTLLKDVAVTSITINADDAYTGNKATLAVTYTPANTSHKGVAWEITAGADYASIDAGTGVLTIKEGASASAVTVKATSSYDNSITATKTISVTYAATVVPVTDITISGGDSTISMQGTLTAVIAPTDATVKTVTWAITSGSDLVTLAADGNTANLTITGVGNVTITATAGDITKSKTISVSNAVSDDTIIQFADATVKSICVANFDTDGDGAIKVGEAKVAGVQNAAYYTPGGYFKGNTAITSFNEFKYFTKIDQLNDDQGFRDCTALKEITLPASMKAFGYNSLYNCTALLHLDIPSGVTVLPNNLVGNCTSLSYVILRSTTVVTISGDPFSGTTCVIYVPDSLYDTYAANSSWTTYKSRLKKLSTLA